MDVPDDLQEAIRAGVRKKKPLVGSVWLTILGFLLPIIWPIILDWLSKLTQVEQAKLYAQAALAVRE